MTKLILYLWIGCMAIGMIGVYWHVMRAIEAVGAVLP